MSSKWPTIKQNFQDQYGEQARRQRQEDCVLKASSDYTRPLKSKT